MTFLRLALASLLALALGTYALAAEDKAEDKDKGKDKDKPAAADEIQPSFGMELAEADRMLGNTERWQVAYRIATPSTLETRCRYDKLVDYTLRFYLGKCCFIEKTASVQESELKQVFDYYADELGETEEATESSDKTMIFSRWKSQGREVELTATRRSTGSYLLTYTEFDIEIDKKARRVQESELDALAASEAAAPTAAP